MTLCANWNTTLASPDKVYSDSAMLATRRKCIHCRKRLVSRARELCAVCYRSRKIRRSYPPTPRQDPSGYDYTTRVPCEPTDAWPGTNEKLAVLMRRAANGEHLFHADDPRITPDAKDCPDIIDDGHYMHRRD